MSVDEPVVTVETSTGPNGEVPEPTTYDLIRSELYDKLIAEDPDRPQLAITIATLYAEVATANLPATMTQLREVFAVLEQVFGGGGGGLPKLLGKLAGKK